MIGKNTHDGKLYTTVYNNIKSNQWCQLLWISPLFSKISCPYIFDNIWINIITANTYIQIHYILCHSHIITNINYYNLLYLTILFPMFGISQNKMIEYSYLICLYFIHDGIIKHASNKNHRFCTVNCEQYNSSSIYGF